MKKVLFIIVLAGLAAGSFYVAQSPELRSMVEKDVPQIELTEAPKGLGDQPGKGVITLRDQGAGVKSVSVVLRQGEKAAALFTEELTQPLGEKVIEIELPGRSGGFKEGTAELEIETVDGSLWKNSAKSTSEVRIDYARPKLETLTLQHVGAQGGAEFVAFRASDANLTSVGALSAGYITKAVPLSALDPAFEAQKDVYGVLVPIPLGFDRSTEKMEIFAEDLVGNRTAIELRFPVKPKKQNDVQSKLSENFVRSKVFLLVPGFEAMSGTDVDTDVSGDEALAAIFKHINEDYRRLLNEKIMRLNEQSAGEFLWKGVFIKPMPSATSSTFGEKRRYSLNGIDAGGSRHDGLDLASVRQDEVLAANDGVVLYAGELGIYGEAVIIDHGLELISLYGHLSSIAVNDGDKVTKGQKIGRSGETGLAGGDHLHFELRIANVPVDPREWWDMHWIEDNILGKLEFTKERLGLIVPADAAQAG